MAGSRGTGLNDQDIEEPQSAISVSPQRGHENLRDAGTLHPLCRSTSMRGRGCRFSCYVGVCPYRATGHQGIPTMD